MPIYLHIYCSPICRQTIAKLALRLSRIALFVNRAASANAKRGVSYPFIVSHTYRCLFPRSSELSLTLYRETFANNDKFDKPLKPWNALTFLIVTPLLWNTNVFFVFVFGSQATPDINSISITQTGSNAFLFFFFCCCLVDEVWQQCGCSVAGAAFDCMY